MSVFKVRLGQIVVLTAVVALAPLASPAQAVFCTNCATELTQLANNIQLVAQLARQVEMVREQVQQTANLVLNTQKLDGLTWGETVAEIRKLNDLLGQAKALSFTARDLDSAFSRKYGDYNSYVAQQPGEEALGERLQQWSEDTNSSVLSTLKAAGLSAQQIEGEEDSYLRSLERLAESAEGRMQAIQVGNQIAMAGARQTQKLRHMMLVQLQLIAGFIARQSDKDTTAAANWRNFSKVQTLPTGNGRRY